MDGSKGARHREGFIYVEEQTRLAESAASHHLHEFLSERPVRKIVMGSIACDLICHVTYANA